MPSHLHALGALSAASSSSGSFSFPLYDRSDPHIVGIFAGVALGLLVMGVAGAACVRTGAWTKMRRWCGLSGSGGANHRSGGNHAIGDGSMQLASGRDSSVLHVTLEEEKEEEEGEETIAHEQPPPPQQLR